MGLGTWEPVSCGNNSVGTWEGGDLEAGPRCRPWFAAYGRASPADLHEPSLSHPIGLPQSSPPVCGYITLKFHEDFVYMYKQKAPNN